MNSKLTSHGLQITFAFRAEVVCFPDQMHDVVNLTCKFAILLDIERNKFQVVGKQWTSSKWGTCCFSFSATPPFLPKLTDAPSAPNPTTFSFQFVTSILLNADSTAWITPSLIKDDNT